MPAGIVEDENDAPPAPGARFLREEIQQRLEQRFGNAVRDIPEAFAGGRRHESGDIEPFEAVMAMGDGTFADRRPYPADHRLQAYAMFVRGEGLDRDVGVLRGFLRDRVGEFFLKASCSSGVAAFGFLGRGFWIDQPIARKASQPRCGATEAKPSSPASQFAALPLVHTPPSGGGAARRVRKRARSSGFRIVADVPLRRRRSPNADG